MRRPTRVIVTSVSRASGHVSVHSEKEVFETLARVGHTAELEASGATEGTTEAVGRRSPLC